MSQTGKIPLLISYIVLSYKKFDSTTGPCLNTLISQLDFATDELVVVDNGSDDGSQLQCKELAQLYPRLRYHPLDQNMGFSAGMNFGVNTSSGDWIVLVNSDTLFPKGAIEAMRTTLQSVPEMVGMVGPLTQSAGNGQCIPLPSSSLEVALETGATLMQEPTGLLTPQYRTDFFCVAIRRSVWTELGGLDTIFGLGYYEDVDFSLRMRSAGYEQVIAEDVFVVHAGSASFATMKVEQKKLIQKNKRIFLNKHPMATLSHQRDCMMKVIEYTLNQDALPMSSKSAILARLQLRLQTLAYVQPRSLFKRFIWRIKVTKLQNELKKKFDYYFNINWN